jgi:hypothetical protein
MSQPPWDLLWSFLLWSFWVLAAMGALIIIVAVVVGFVRGVTALIFKR